MNTSFTFETEPFQGYRHGYGLKGEAPEQIAREPFGNYRRFTQALERFDKEGETSHSESALNVLSPSDLKAVRITSTFETGRAGSFGGLAGNFDGQGLSFGLLNFTVKAGSLIPLLQEFINKYPQRYEAAFGKDAPQFKEIVFARIPDPKNPRRFIRDVNRQMNFVNIRMNAAPKKAKHNRIIEPWKMYFGRLENDPEFRKIQVRAVRRALDQARRWFHQFGFKTERGLAFMFDLVSSHGGAWLNAPKFKGKRRALLQTMLDEKKEQLGRDTLTELETMAVIANMVADVSSQEWREKVRVRKLWFVLGKGRVHGKDYDIKKDFGITDNPPDLNPAANEAGEFAWELSNGLEREHEIDRPSAAPAPTLLGSRSDALGATVYVRINLGMGRNRAGNTFRLPSVTGIYIPPSFSLESPVDLICYLHGHKGAYPGDTVLIDGYWDGTRFPFFGLREEVKASKRNVIFVAPSLGTTSQAGNLTEHGGFDSYMSQVVAALSKYYVMPRYGRPIHDVRHVVLAAHSGGGAAMLRIAAGRDRNAARIKECWCFDCMYGFVSGEWVRWARSHSKSALSVYYGPGKGTVNPKTGKKAAFPRDNAEAIACASKIQRLANVCVQPSRAKTSKQVSAHFWVPKVHLKERLLGSPCPARNICPTTQPGGHSELEVAMAGQSDWQAIKDRAVVLATQEYERWDFGHRHETNANYFDTLKKYYVESGIANVANAEATVRRIQCRKQLPSGKWVGCYEHIPPWSAAFISWVMRAAGVAPKYFKPSGGHHVYVSAAKKNRMSNDTKMPFWAFRISEMKPAQGDLICNARCDPKEPTRCGATYDTVDKLKEPSLHCDIVVDVQSDHVLVIGGNTRDQFGGLKGNTVGMKKVFLDATGKVKKTPKTNYIALIKFRTDAQPG